MLSVLLGRAARAEYLAAALRYEQLRTGLGAQFAAEIRQALELASEFPERARIVEADIRRLKVHRFPYHVYFRKRRNWLVVIAIFHSRRNPRVWRRRT